MKRAFALAIATLALAACGGGHALPPIVQRVLSPTITLAAPSPTPTPKTGTAAFTIVIPAPAASHAHYVSSGTRSMVVVLTSINGSSTGKHPPTLTVNTVPHAHGCKSAASLTCTADFKVPIGRALFAVTLYDATKGGGKALASASTGGTIKKDTTTAIKLVPDGIPAALIIKPDIVTPPANGSTQTLSFVVNAVDAAGSTIVAPGAYTQTISLSIGGDSGGALSLQPDSLSAPGKPVTVKYESSTPLTHATLSATAKGAAAGLATINPLVVSPLSLPGLFGGSLSQNQTVTVSEYGQAAPFTIVNSSSAVTVACIPSNCAPVSPGATVHITLGVKAAGTGTLSIRDPNGSAVSLPYSAADVTLYPNFAGSINGLDSVAIGSDGNLWGLTDAGTLVRLHGGTTSSYGLVNWAGANAPQVISGGTDHALWYVDGTTSAITRFGLGNGDFASTVQYQTGDSGAATAITLGPDGALWYTESSGSIGRITTSGTVSTFSNASGVGGSAIVSGPDGALWLVDTGSLFRIDTAGNVTSFSGLYANGQAFNPVALTAGYGNDLWLAGYNGQLCDFSTGGAITSCLQTTLSLVTALAKGPDGVLWAVGLDTNGTTAVERVAGVNDLNEYVLPQSETAQQNGLVSGLGSLWVPAGTGGLVQLTVPPAAASRGAR